MTSQEVATPHDPTVWLHHAAYIISEGTEVGGDSNDHVVNENADAGDAGDKRAALHVLSRGLEVRYWICHKYWIHHIITVYFIILLYIIPLHVSQYIYIYIYVCVCTRVRVRVCKGVSAMDVRLAMRY